MLKEWLLSEEHFTHPYPTNEDQAELMAKTGIDKKQLKVTVVNGLTVTARPRAPEREISP